MLKDFLKWFAFLFLILTMFLFSALSSLMYFGGNSVLSPIYVLIGLTLSILLFLIMSWRFVNDLDKN